MKKILVFLLILNFAFSYSFKQTKQLIETNSTKIGKILKSKDAIYLLETAIYLDRIDLIKKAKKIGFDFSTKDKEGNNLLMFSSFFAKPKFVKYLVEIIDPNEINKKGSNSLSMVMLGINQEYPFVFSNRYSVKKNKKEFKIYKEKIKNNIIKTADILRKNYAKSEYITSYQVSTFSIFRSYIERHLKDKKPINKELTDFLLNHYLNDKQKMFLYFILKEDKKAKEILQKHIEFLKDPYYLDFKYHFLYLLAKMGRIDIAKYMINLAKKHNIDLINYKITSEYSKNVDDLEGMFWSKKFWELVKDELKPQKDIFDLVHDDKYKEIKKLSKQYFLNTIKYAYEVDMKQPFKYTTPLLTAIYLKNTKMVKFLLDNGFYISGWNEIHYKILKYEKLNLDKYPKWQRVYKINQAGLLEKLTPLDIAIIYDPNYIDELLENGAKINSNSLNLAIEYNLEEKIKPFIKSVDDSNLRQLATKGKIDYLKYLFDKKVINLDDLEYLNNKLKNTKYYEKFFDTFKKQLLEKKCSNIEVGYMKRIDKRLVKQCLENKFELSDEVLEKLFIQSDDELMPLLVRYKDKKLYGKYYPLFYIYKRKFLKDFITPKSKSQLDYALCKISIKEKKPDKKVCKKLVNLMLKEGNKISALYIAIKSNNTNLLSEDDIKQMSASSRLCYYLDTNLTKAIKFYKENIDLKPNCYIFNENIIKNYKNFKSLIKIPTEKLDKAVDTNDIKRP